MTIKAYRAGKTASRWTDDCCNEKLFEGTKKISFTLSMPSKGGGVTDVKLEVTSESFEVLAQSMIGADYNATILAFISRGYWQLIVEAMMENDQESTIRTFGRVLRQNNDPAVGACGTILLAKVGD